MSKRMGIDKLFCTLKGRPIVVYIIKKLRKLSELSKIIVIASPRNVEGFHELGIDVIIDEMLMGPLGALYLALRMFREVLIVPGNTSLVSIETLRNLVTSCSSEYYACIPRWKSGFIEPLHATYRYGVLKSLELGYLRGSNLYDAFLIR